MIGLIDLPDRLPAESASRPRSPRRRRFPLVALAWTLLITGYLVWTFLGRHDERRLLAELDAAYGVPPEPPSD